MKRFVLLLLVYLFTPFVFAQSVLPYSSVNLIRGVSAQSLTPVTTKLARRMLAGIRKNTQLPSGLLARARKGVVQIARPSWENGKLQTPSSVYASGFLLRYQNRLWVASAYHVMGGKGSKRVVRIPTREGTEHDVLVEVEVNGRAGLHEPDISLAPIRAEDIPEGMEPLTVAEPMLDQPAYSVGYMTGNFSFDDFLPVKRTFTESTGNSLYGAYHIEGSSPLVPITGNGQCGSPIFQYFPGQQEKWQVVGLHNGHLLDWENSARSRGSGVNLSKILPYLVTDNLPVRDLSFRGERVTRLHPNERVAEIALIRNGEVLTTKYMKLFEYPYEDAHAEMALWNESLKTGDMIEFTIQRRQTVEPKRSTRKTVFFVR